MAKFYFDTRDGERFYPDDEGRELDGLVADRIEAGASLAESPSSFRLRLPSFIK